MPVTRFDGHTLPQALMTIRYAKPHPQQLMTPKTCVPRTVTTDVAVTSLRVLIEFLSLKLQDARVVLWPASCTPTPVQTILPYSSLPHLARRSNAWFVYTSISQIFLVTEHSFNSVNTYETRTFCGGARGGAVG